ncbi:MAG: hypothetical protein LUH07_12715 [Lachnospiraceae bacterium]|nr:hypothetical protein [Lachnospiraceae bacterium]
MEETNQKGKALLSDPKLSQTADDRAYEAAESVMSEVEEILEDCSELIEQVESALTAYDDFLFQLEY